MGYKTSEAWFQEWLGVVKQIGEGGGGVTTAMCAYNMQVALRLTSLFRSLC